MSNTEHQENRYVKLYFVILTSVLRRNSDLNPKHAKALFSNSNLFIVNQVKEIAAFLTKIYWDGGGEGCISGS